MAADGVRFFLVDDHETFRVGLRTIIEAHHSDRIVAEASTVREALSHLDELQFDVMVVDLTMPGSSGLSLIRELRRRGRPEKVLVLTMHVTADVAAEAFAAGATGFASKGDSAAAIRDALDTVARGERYVPGNLPLKSIDQFLRLRPPASGAEGPLASLSQREREVFDLLTRGYSHEEIGKELFISAKTVDTHQTHLFRKLQIHSRFELLRFAFRHQLLHETAVGDSGKDELAK